MDSDAVTRARHAQRWAAHGRSCQVASEDVYCGGFPVNWQSNLSIGVLATIAGAVIWELLRLVWRWLTVIAPSRSFWRLAPADEVHVAVSLHDTDPSERTIYIPTGDSLAFGEIVAFLRRLYPKAKITFHGNANQPLTDWNRTIVLIGGGKSNLTFRSLQAALNPPMHGYDHQYPPHYDPKGFIFREDEQVRLEPAFEGGLLSTDVAVVIRAPNPFYKKKYVFIFVGAYAHGTYGAALWATRPKNLAWLWRCHIRWRLAELISRKPATDSVEVALRVPAVGQLSRGEIPSMGEPEVWHHKGRGEPYYFYAPDRYADSYNRVVVENP